ncbi:hypothetical protein QG052_08660 [Kingella kingae]|uniref:hypothetical protein n=1 Tax=Kingella kingae TaxID=504 RepID=UPI000570BE18|nr:hypothetical protein [Kingella kingae]MDK4593391.1 hypothetical protein [Kingella kingae]MDK4595399.1 hypothetical protein [Kingella kingae]MDK4597443.1 hypothetical protein [Kingella kingae]MDK4601390.1 hypothetical protein [Kingella kingae]MDK4645074.1 hypothetical protein [Kingella kingae]
MTQKILIYADIYESIYESKFFGNNKVQLCYSNIQAKNPSEQALIDECIQKMREDNNELLLENQTYYPVLGSVRDLNSGMAFISPKLKIKNASLILDIKNKKFE